MNIFLGIESREERNPIKAAVKAVLEAAGATVVDQVVCDDVEAEIAVTNSVASALRLTKETETTKIVIAYFGREQREGALAFAERYSDRVTAVPIVGLGRDEEKPELVLFLLTLIGKEKEN